MRFCCLPSLPPPRHLPSGVDQKAVVTLDVGGNIFTTSRETLSACKKLADLTLRQPGPDGAYFLDRDGRYYSEVLNFLRDGPDNYTVPLKEEVRLALEREAIYLELNALTCSLRKTFRQTFRGAPLPPDESQRLQRLTGLKIMHTDEHEHHYDSISRVVAALLDMPITLISLVGRDQQWFKSRCGFPMSTISREASICAFTLLPPEPTSMSLLAIEDARRDPRFSSNPLVVGEPHIVSYAGCPLVTSDGLRMGALSACDYVPRTLSAMQSQLLMSFGQIVAQEIERKELLEHHFESEGLPGEPPGPEDFCMGQLRQARMRDALSEAVCLVSARPDTLHWPILYANRTWTSLSGIRITPPQRLPGSAMADGVGLRRVAAGEGAGRELSFWDWLRLADRREQQFRRQMRKEWEQPQAKIFALDGTAPAVPENGQAEQDTNAERMAITCRFVPCELPLDVATPAFREPPSGDSSPRDPAETQAAGKAPGEAMEERFYFVTMVRTTLKSPRQRIHQPVTAPSARAGAQALDTQGAGAQGKTRSPFLDVRLMRLVGKGSFGKVYYGLWMGTPVAVKVLRTQAEASSSLRHPNIVQAYRHEGRVIGPELSSETWVVQEWCDRGTLREFCNEPREGSENVEEVLGICSDIAGGGSYLHSKGIIHGDLTASNVLIKTQVTRRGYVCKICDFGLAKVLEGGSASIVTSQLSTVSHLPPEVLESDQNTLLTTKADVYAAGILLWQAVRGKSPFAGLSPQRVIIEVASGRRLQLPESTPKEVRDVFDRCTSTNPLQRPSFDDLVQIFSGPLASVIVT